MLLADEVAHCAVPGVAVGQHTGRAGVEAQLVLDRKTGEVVAIAEAPVVVHEVLGDDKARDPPGAGRAVGGAGEHQVDDVVGQFVLAVGDEDLGPEDPMGAVTLGFGPRGERAHVGARLGFGQVHGAGPLGGNHAGQEGLLQAFVAE